MIMHRQFKGSKKEICITVVCFISLHKAPAVDINDLTFLAIIAPEHVEATDSLPEAFTYLCGPRSFFFGESCDESGNCC